MKVIIKLSLPVGLFIWLVYQVASRFITIQDTVAIPMMIISILFMMIGIAYHGWCFGRGKNPYDLKGQKKPKDK
ncbi:MAG: hypothetical protein K0R34_2444 [Herbinix sp.]|jgi:hypothetical protein|nr:hypothetical protein [Herbinix sp.]